MSVIEASIENYLIKKVKAAGGQIIKIEKRAHWPDRLVCLPVGGLYLVELKKPKGGRLSGGQKMLREEVLDPMGVEVHVLYTKAQVDAFIKENTNG